MVVTTTGPTGAVAAARSRCSPPPLLSLPWLPPPLPLWPELANCGTVKGALHCSLSLTISVFAIADASHTLESCACDVVTQLPIPITANCSQAGERSGSDTTEGSGSCAPFF